MLTKLWYIDGKWQTMIMAYIRIRHGHRMISLNFGQTTKKHSEKMRPIFGTISLSILISHWNNLIIVKRENLRTTMGSMGYD